ncbi:proline hydroxylase [Streptomyces sp. N35]|uniref:proline hydroxylase n=1 Tax=Streptomyces sp. N35 TaxID=2795730 RepID=UPI0018F6616E|nr:proline hydroxylase [Streptomyces sp. N35]
MFSVVRSAAFTEQHLAALAAGTIAAVHVPGFLTRTTCQTALDALTNLPTISYDPARVPTPIVRFGPSLNDYRRPHPQTTTAPGLDTGRYWAAAAEARAAWRHSGPRPDPVAYAIKHLSAAWGSTIAPATIHGRPVFGGTLREISQGTLIHDDDVSRELPGLFDQPVVAQLAFNTWLQTPPTGGATTIWRHRPNPGDAQHRHFYGYRPAAVANSPHVRLIPEQGDALIFAPTNLHTVDPSQGGHRVAAAFFLGLTTTGRFIYWS